MLAACEPILKWAGGKRNLLPELLPHLPPLGPEATYYEPFLGSAALFFALHPRRAVLSDTVPQLIETYDAVRDDVEAVIGRLRRLKNTPEDYYRARASRPRTAHARAARFIYLNKTCFNGLYRVNLKGDFNVPHGRHGPNLRICDETALRRASTALGTAGLKVQDFEDAVSGARKGDVVFFDPPYTTAHSNNGFIEYNAEVFSWLDQSRLAQVAGMLARRGVFVLVTNASHSSIRQLYGDQGFEILAHSRWSTMAASASKRFITSELIMIGGR